MYGSVYALAHSPLFVPLHVRPSAYRLPELHLLCLVHIPLCYFTTRILFGLRPFAARRRCRLAFLHFPLYNFTPIDENSFG